MSDFAIIFQGLAAVLLLFFIFATYMNTKTWQWVHVTFTFLVFAASAAFMFYAAMALKTRAAWIGHLDKLEKQLAQTEEQLERVTRGDPKDVEGKTPSVVSVREEVGRTILDRGRVWRNCFPTFNADGTITVATAPPQDPNLPQPAGGAKKNNIAVKTVLHAFAEGERTPEGLANPAVYIGEFQAIVVSDQSVTLAPTMPYDVAATRLRYQSGAPVTWALYEVCPIDGHEWLAGLNQETLQNMMPQRATGLPNDRFQKLIQSYVRDGQQAEDTDPPENVWVEVKFLKPYEITVDAPTVSSLETEPFNLEGQAVLDRLRRARSGQESKPIKFGPLPEQGASPDEQVHQTAILDKETADSLIDQGICEKVRPIYRRTLTDYERKFHAVYQRIVDISGRMRQLDLDNKALVASTEKANQQSKLIEEFKAKLGDDLAKARLELAELNKYADSLSGRLTSVQEELSQLYRSNKAISRELAETSARLTEEINRRTREATARTP